VLAVRYAQQRNERFIPILFVRGPELISYHLVIGPAKEPLPGPCRQRVVRDREKNLRHGVATRWSVERLVSGRFYALFLARSLPPASPRWGNKSH